MIAKDELVSRMEDKEFQRQLVGAFSGPYSVGIGADPDNPEDPAIVVSFTGTPPARFPRSIKVGDGSVRVIAKPGFVTPKPL